MPDRRERQPATQAAPYQKRRQGTNLAFAVILVGLVAEVLVLYGPALRFSFLLDDSYDLVIVRQTSYRELLLRPLPGFSYYRPLSFALYKLVHDLWGETEPWHYHLLSVSLHALNTLLLALLIRKVAGIVAAALSASLFAAFPFAYQAVQIACSLPHLLVTSAMLGTLVLWEQGMEQPGRTRRLLRCSATAMALAAPGFHETGVLTGTLVILWTALRLFQREAAPASLRLRATAVGLLLVVVQIYLGALVAGLDAGMAYNTWPTLDGALVPGGLFVQQPWWANLFENPKTVQFLHRAGAYVLLLAALWHVITTLRAEPGTQHAARSVLLFAMICGQAALGITALVLVVPFGWALAHHAFAIVTLGFAVAHWRGTVGAYPLIQTEPARSKQSLFT